MRRERKGGGEKEKARLGHCTRERRGSAQLYERAKGEVLLPVLSVSVVEEADDSP